jgi:hypothetical protein
MTSFEIAADWSWAESGPDLLRATAAELTLKVGDQVLTRTYDTWSKTVTERARVSAYPLAEWLVVSWWRLRYEPSPEAGARPSPNWRIAHDLAAAGHGYVWPRVRISSDGEAMQVSARRGQQAGWEPGRYLTDLPATRVAHDVFDGQVDAFVRLVLDRLYDTGANAEQLRSLWADVLEERKDPEVSAWRELEARLGYCADEAPEALMDALDSLAATVGKAAAMEIAPVIGSEQPEPRLAQIRHLAEQPAVPAKLELDARAIEISHDGEITPWMRGRRLATAVRRATGLRGGPVSNESLCALLGMRQDTWEMHSPSTPLLSLGLRHGDAGRLDLHFRKPHITGRRFEAARFIADQLMTPEHEVWLPQTNAATARQQVQRSFAAEFLVPIKGLLDFLNDTLTEDAFDDAGEYFRVSPLAIRSHLVNNDVIQAEAVGLI